MKYRIVGKYKNNKLVYKVQENLLFGFPLFWTTVTYWGPHPDLAIPACCIVNCIFSNIKDAEKCLNGLMNKLSNGKSQDFRCDLTEWLKFLKLRVGGFRVKSK